MIYLVAMFADQFTIFVVAMVILTFGEMLVWLAIPSFANDLAPKGRAGFYQGIVNRVASGGRMIGPVFGRLIVDIFIPFVTTSIYD